MSAEKPVIYNQLRDWWNNTNIMFQMIMLHNIWEDVAALDKQPILTQEGIDVLTRLGQDNSNAINPEELMTYGQILPSDNTLQIHGILYTENVSPYNDMTYQEFANTLIEAAGNPALAEIVAGNLLGLLIKKTLTFRAAVLELTDNYEFAGEAPLGEAATPNDLLRRDKKVMTRYGESPENPDEDSYAFAELNTVRATLFSSEHVLEQLIPSQVARAEYLMDTVLRSLPRRALAVLLENSMITQDPVMAVRVAKVLVHLTPLSEEFSDLTPPDLSLGLYQNTLDNTLVLGPDPNNPSVRLLDNAWRILEAAKEQIHAYARQIEMTKAQIEALIEANELPAFREMGELPTLKQARDTLEQLVTEQEFSLLPPDYLAPYLTNTAPDIAQRIDIARQYRQNNEQGR